MFEEQALSDASADESSTNASISSGTNRYLDTLCEKIFGVPAAA